jgi:aryl-alcohol dehydrogenase-like predicted oxidoreductase/NAD-dependent dihydropyrimidine dehydrogenase PreA subunit
MEYRELGGTGITVSRLCFGVLTIGPLQANLAVSEGAGIIRYALEHGVNFMDTAQYYQTYPFIKEALKGYHGQVIIASKSYAYTREMMEKSVEEARREMGRDVIDIFLLHEQESVLTIKGHWEAYEYLLECKQRGIIRAAGISTHTIAGVIAAAQISEIDVIHPLYNMRGVGIVDGNVEEMGNVIDYAVKARKGIYGMKPLGGGNLLGDSAVAFEFVLSNNNLHSIAVGMKSLAEVDLNTRLFRGEEVSSALWDKVSAIPRSLHIESWCNGCGSCVKLCTAGAISIQQGKAWVDKSLCRVCGYCGPECKEFCIKVI